MAKLLRNKEWKFWIVMNSHTCRFCYWANHNNGTPYPDSSGIGRHAGGTQCDKGYWNRAYQAWVKHMKECHPEIWAERK